MKFSWSRMRREEELEEEIRSHLRMAEQDCIDRGESPEQARYSVRREFGNLDLVKESVRANWGSFWLERLVQDLRYGLRMLRRNPGFSLTAILTLAFGIGANIAVFNVVNSVLLRPLPFPRAGELVRIANKLPIGILPDFFGPTAFWAFQHQTWNLSEIAAYSIDQTNLSGAEGAERVGMCRVSASFFPLLGVQPRVGRGFLAEENQPGGRPVVILSDGLWKRRFGGNPGVVGRSLLLDGVSFWVIGILPSWFDLPDNRSTSIDLWIPSVPRASDRDNAYLFISLIGRLRPSSQLQVARAELDNIYQTTLFRGLGHAYVAGLQEELNKNTRLSLLMFLGAAGFVLLIAIVNVANLLLARTIAREKEIAVRSALGARGSRIFRQLFTECSLIAFLGGGLGLGLAFCTRNLLRFLIPDSLRHVYSTPIDLWVFSFALLITLITSTSIVMAAVWQTSCFRAGESLKSSKGSSIGPSFHRTRHLLVIAEVGLATVLLIGAGLFLRSLLSLRQINPGYRPENVLSMTIDLTRNKYPSPRSQSVYFEQALGRLRNISGIESAAVTNTLPLSGNIGFGTGGSEIQGISKQEPIDVLVVSASAGYFRMMSIPLLRGRTFTDQDRDGTPRVAIVDDAFVRHFFPDRDPIGRQIQVPNYFGNRISMTIVGVVGDVHPLNLEREICPQMYTPYLQSGYPISKLSLVIRCADDPAKLAGPVRDALKSIDADQPFFDMMDLEERLSRSYSQRSANLILIGTCSALALILAFIGIYGVVSYTVSRRTHEIGIRRALGAQSFDIMQMIVKQFMTSAIVGLVLGLAGAFALMRYISSLLYRVSATDPAVFAGISALVLISAFLAGYIPSRQATKIDLSATLRNE